MILSVTADEGTMAAMEDATVELGGDSLDGYLDDGYGDQSSMGNGLGGDSMGFTRVDSISRTTGQGPRPHRAASPYAPPRAPAGQI